jgi:nicastrin
MKSFAGSDRVAGVIVIKRMNQTDTWIPSSFSPESSCPNDGYGLYRDDQNPEFAHCQKRQWVKDNDATGLMSLSIPFPVFYLTEQDSIDKVLSCYNKFNRPSDDGMARPWPLCAAQLQSLMHAAVHTPKCMYRSDVFTSAMDGSRFCDPLSSRNIFTYLIPRGHKHEYGNRSVILVVARLDSLSMFEGMSHGADSAITGVVTLLSVARTLASARETIEMANPKKHVVFAIFDGEAFDYIGSSATVYDMERNLFPKTRGGIHPAKISLSQISHVIELNQLAKHKSTSEGASIFMHSDPVTKGRTGALVEDFFNSMKKEGDKAVGRADPGQGLPPSSVQSFLRKDGQIAGIHVSNHEKEFQNLHYNSLFDTVEQLSAFEYNESFVNHILKASKIISRSLFKLMTGKEAGTLNHDEELVSSFEEDFHFR